MVSSSSVRLREREIICLTNALARGGQILQDQKSEFKGRFFFFCTDNKLERLTRLQSLRKVRYPRTKVGVSTDFSDVNPLLASLAIVRATISNDTPFDMNLLFGLHKRRWNEVSSRYILL